jgi:hypothetical protein
MEYMGPIFMDIYAFNVFAINIAPDVISLVDNQHILACVGCFPRENRAKKTRSNNNIIVLTH